jgi:hypothetical protein
MPAPKEVKVDIVGGLGNQLFCYSAGRFLAHRLDAPLNCVFNAQRNSTSRKPTSLTNLGLDAKFTFPKFHRSPIARLMRALKYLEKRCHLHFKPRHNGHFFSQQIGYDFLIEDIAQPTHLHGYFQTWKYADSAREEIRRSLERLSLSVDAEILSTRISVEKSFVIHVRLGDFLNPENSYFGILSPDYYRQILLKIDKSKYQIFVFSDDIVQAQKNYKHVFPDCVIWADPENRLSDVETLAVMTKGNGYAIANSTYSWWAAYLSNNPDFVVAPSKWFKEKEDPKYLMPPDWEMELSIWVE